MAARTLITFIFLWIVSVFFGCADGERSIAAFTSGGGYDPICQSYPLRKTPEANETRQFIEKDIEGTRFTFVATDGVSADDVEAFAVALGETNRMLATSVVLPKEATIVLCPAGLNAHSVIALEQPTILSFVRVGANVNDKDVILNTRAIEFTLHEYGHIILFETLSQRLKDFATFKAYRQKDNEQKLVNAEIALIADQPLEQKTLTKRLGEISTELFELAGQIGQGYRILNVHGELFADLIPALWSNNPAANTAAFLELGVAEQDINFRDFSKQIAPENLAVQDIYSASTGVRNRIWNASQIVEAHRIVSTLAEIIGSDIQTFTDAKQAPPSSAADYSTRINERMDSYPIFTPANEALP